MMGLIVGYGEHSSSCRQLPNAPREHNSRAMMLRPGRKVFTRPASFLITCCLMRTAAHLCAPARNKVCMYERREAGAIARAIAKATSRHQLQPFGLRCYINSAESLMGGQHLIT